MMILQEKLDQYTVDIKCMTYPCFIARTFDATINLVLFFSREGFAVTQLEITIHT